MAGRLVDAVQGTPNEGFHKVISAYMAATGGKRTFQLLSIEVNLLALFFNGVRPIPYSLLL